MIRVYLKEFILMFITNTNQIVVRFVLFCVNFVKDFVSTSFRKHSIISDE